MLNFLEILFSWPKFYITGTELHFILKEGSNHSRYGIIKRTIQKGYLIPIRRDFYLIKNFRKIVPDVFEIAPLIYGPSYISFESALSYHGLIPEGVRSITSASVKRSKEFETSLGIFSYEHIPSNSFPFGVEQHQQNGITLFIASPLKALADIVYARKRCWLTMKDLSEDLRIEIDSFQNYNASSFNSIIQNYLSTRVNKTLSNLQKDLKLK